MGGNKAVMSVVLVVVIAVAAWGIYSGMKEDTSIPDHVLNKKHKYIVAQEPWTVEEITYKEWISYPQDKATGYRTKDGKKWASVMTCASCKQQIPVQARQMKAPKPADGAAEAPDEPKPYKCPRCGKEANEAVLEMQKGRR